MKAFFKISLRLVLACATLFSAHDLLAQCGDSIDLGTWIKEGNPANGNWVVTNGGNNVNQSINGEPTFYVSPDSFLNVIITGRIQVATAADDDWVGFVFGYVDPDSNDPNYYDFYLFDWKQTNQNFGGFLGQEGYSLSRVNGAIVNFPQAFSSKAGPFVNLLGTQYGAAFGWNDFQVYDFALTYTNTRTVISIDGDTIFDIFGCFPPGRFGFYNYSQASVNYSDFSYRVAAAFEVLTPDVCLGDTARFIALSDSCVNAAGIPVNNTLTNWYWEFGDGSTSNDTNANHYYTNPGTYTVQLVVTDYLGCTDTAYSQVNVFDVNTNLGNDTAICTNDFITLDADTFANTYLWSTGGTNQTEAVSLPGSYWVAVLGNGGCTDTDTVVITNIALPVVNIGNDTSICNNDSLTLFAGNPGATFLWSTGATVDSIVVNDSGTFTVIVTNDSFCSTIDTIIIDNYAQPTVTPPNPELCFGDTITVTAAGALTYTWYPAAGLSSTTGASVEIFTLVDTVYHVIGIDTNGCTDTSDFTVDVHPLPTFDITGGDTVCIGDSVTLTFNLTGTGPWDVQYSVQNTVQTITGINNPSFTLVVTDSGTYQPISVTDINCSDTGGISAYVFHHPLPMISFLPAAPEMCIGDTITMSALGAATYIWSPNYNISSLTGDSVNVSPTNDTSYIVEATDSNGCVNNDTVQVIVHPLPIIAFNPASLAYCEFDTVSIQATGALSYQWFPAVGLSDSIGDIVDVFVLNDTTYTVTGTDTNGCVNSNTFLVDVHPLPTFDISGSDTVCIGDTVVLTFSVTGTGPWDLSYSVQNTVVNLNGITTPSFTINALDSGTYQPLTIADALCTNTLGQSALVHHLPLPVITFVPALPEMCIEDTLMLQAQGAQTYTWGPNYNATVLVGDSIGVFPTADTSYFVIATDSNNCTNSDTVDVIVHPLPVITLNVSAETICKLDTTFIQASGAVSYVWDNTPGLNNYTQPNVAATPLVTSIYNVVGTDVNGCVNSNDTTITVLVLPDIVLTPGVGAICIGESATITAPNAYDLVWSPLLHLQLDGNNNDTVIASPQDTTLYTVVATDSLGCISDTTYSLAVTPLPVLTVTSDDSVICPGVPTGLDVSGANSYVWSPPTSLSNIFSASPNASPTSTRTYFVTGTGPGGCQSVDSITIAVYTIAPFGVNDDTAICRRDTAQLSAFGGVSYQWLPNLGLSNNQIANPLCFSQSTRLYAVFITDDNGCISQANTTVTVNPLPFATPGNNDTICVGQSTRLGGVPTGPAGSTYTWTPAAGLDNAFLPNPFASPSSTTLYNLLVTDVNGCQRANDVLVTVNPLPIMELLDQPDYLCEGDTGVIEVTAGIPNYQWTPETRVFSPNSNRSFVNPRTSLVYQIVGTDDNGCATTLNVNLTVEPEPFVNIQGNYEMCIGDTIELSANAGPGTLEWFPAEFVSQPDTLLPFVFPTEPTYFRLRLTNDLGCRSTDTSLVFVHPLPRADAGEDIDNCNMQVFYLGGPSVTGPENDIRWSPAEKLSNPTIERPRVLSTEIDTFTLRVESPEGCVNYDTIIVNSDCYISMYAPNSFSPDGDGLNDVFHVVGRNVFNIHLIIYDRLGHVIFETKDPDRGWDGTHHNNGYDAQIGTYFWQVTYESESGRALSTEGIVNLLR